MEESKEKVRRVKKKYIDEKYPFKVNEVFLFCFLINPPSNCTKHTLTAHRTGMSEDKGFVLNMLRKTQFMLIVSLRNRTAGRRGQQNVCM